MNGGSLPPAVQGRMSPFHDLDMDLVADRLSDALAEDLAKKIKLANSTIDRSEFNAINSMVSDSYSQMAMNIHAINESFYNIEGYTAGLGTLPLDSNFEDIAGYDMSIINTSKLINTVNDYYGQYRKHVNGKSFFLNTALGNYISEEIQYLAYNTEGEIAYRLTGDIRYKALSMERQFDFKDDFDLIGAGLELSLESVIEVGLMGLEGSNLVANNILKTPALKSTLVDNIAVNNLDNIIRSAQDDIAEEFVPKVKTDFYVRPDGAIVPATGYRAISVKGLPFAMDGSISPPSGLTYFTTDPIYSYGPMISKELMQLEPLPSNFFAKFDTLQIIDDIRIPTEKWNTGNTLEPFAISYPGLGLGGAQQYITNSEIINYELLEYFLMLEYRK